MYLLFVLLTQNKTVTLCTTNADLDLDTHSMCLIEEGGHSAGNSPLLLQPVNVHILIYEIIYCIIQLYYLYVYS